MHARQEFSVNIKSKEGKTRIMCKFDEGG